MSRSSKWGKGSAASGISKAASVGAVSDASTSSDKKPTMPARKRSDPVNPVHYQGDYVMRVIEDFNLDFLSGTIVKYLLRAGNKPGDSVEQDLLKAKWYLERKLAALATERSE